MINYLYYYNYNNINYNINNTINNIINNNNIMSNDYEYRELIAETCNRALKEEMFQLVETKNSKGQILINVNFHSKPWFEKLDKKLQENVIHNCTHLYKEKLELIMKEQKEVNNNFNYTVDASGH